MFHIVTDLTYQGHRLRVPLVAPILSKRELMSERKGHGLKERMLKKKERIERTAFARYWRPEL